MSYADRVNGFNQALAETSSHINNMASTITKTGSTIPETISNAVAGIGGAGTSISGIYLGYKHAKEYSKFGKDIKGQLNKLGGNKETQNEDEPNTQTRNATDPNEAQGGNEPDIDDDLQARIDAANAAGPDAPDVIGNITPDSAPARNRDMGEPPEDDDAIGQNNYKEGLRSRFKNLDPEAQDNLKQNISNNNVGNSPSSKQNLSDSNDELNNIEKDPNTRFVNNNAKNGDDITGNGTDDGAAQAQGAQANAPDSQTNGGQNGQGANTDDNLGSRSTDVDDLGGDLLDQGPDAQAIAAAPYPPPLNPDWVAQNAPDHQNPDGQNQDLHQTQAQNNQGQANNNAQQRNNGGEDADEDGNGGGPNRPNPQNNGNNDIDTDAPDTDPAGGSGGNGGSWFSKLFGKGGGDDVATAGEDVMEDSEAGGELAPAIAIVGGLMTLGGTIASLFTKPKQTQKTTPPPQQPTISVGANLSQKAVGGGSMATY
jgi:hypothetical protein